MKKRKLSIFDGSRRGFLESSPGIKTFFLVFILFICSGISSQLLGQQQNKIALNLKDASIKEIINTLKAKANCSFVYSDVDLENLPKKSFIFENAALETVLDYCFKDTDLVYEITANNVITISKQKIVRQAQKPVTISGIVTDSNGDPLPGVSIIVKGTKTGVASNEDGLFSITLQDAVGKTLQFSFIGMNTKEHQIKSVNALVKITLEENLMALKEVVFTGVYTRKKESFTGSVSTFTAEEIKSVGNSNIIQSLKTLDPSFALVENNLLGSDPNRLPDIEIRGKSSLIGVRDELAEDPNQPLFILDGFESSLRAIYDLDLDRVASITILKDAASTAIYGSKAANGVVVVETVKPIAGQLRFSYNGAFNVSLPDLSSYNMMDAREKLEFEKLAGRYNLSSSTWSPDNEVLVNQIYNQKLADINRGVDTYWLSEPLRIGMNNRHSIYAQGGEGGFTFGLGAVYNDITGVMKKSKRENISGNLDIIYRVSKLQFSNKLQVGKVDSQDPIVSFDKYANANPYHTKYDNNGEVSKWLENNSLFRASNPMWNDNVGSRNKSKEFNFSNFFIAEFTPNRAFKLRARFGITYNTSDLDNFSSPIDTRYDSEDILNKGVYNSRNYKSSNVEGELTATYAKVIGKQIINLVAGGHMNSYNSLDQGYTVKGFPEGDFSYPSFSKGFQEGGVPRYAQSESRSVSGYINGGYSYDDRFNADLSYRFSGSSVFGATKKFTGTWSLGLAWNLHNESFIKNNFEGIKMLKIRGSIGNPGNQNFSSYMTMTTYGFNFNALNYFGMSSSISALGNPDLQWQKTLDKNIGLDLTVLSNRLNIVADYYHKTTDPLLVSIAVPSSAGVTLAYTNIGDQKSQGFIATAQYYLVYRLQERYTWSVRANIRTAKTELGNLGKSLNEVNKLGQTNNSLKRFYDGADPDALWAVKSAGIDPSTGREIFFKKDGNYSYDFSYDDEIIIGNSRPKIEGVIGSSFNYKGFSFSVDFRYRYGGYAFNSALFEKVENISMDRLSYNQDKRALYERWQKPGDITSFKNIANAQSTPMSSRFIQKDNSISLESMRVGYEFSGNSLNRLLGLGTVRVNAYMNDLLRISTIKAERGIMYPFARSVSVSLSLTF